MHTLKVNNVTIGARALLASSPQLRYRFRTRLQAATSEPAEAQTFWNEFFEVFGVNRKRTGIRFEKDAERFGKRGKGRIDVF